MFRDSVPDDTMLKIKIHLTNFIVHIRPSCDTKMKATTISNWK